MALVIARSESKASPIASPVASYSERNSTNASPPAPYSEDVSTIASPLVPYSEQFSTIAPPPAPYSEDVSTIVSPAAPYSEDVSTIASPLAPYSGRGVGGEGQTEDGIKAASDLTTGELSDYIDLVPYSPLRPIFRDLALAGAELEISGDVLQAIFVDMDLPELAITGPAIVHEIRNAPTVKPGAGRVITATFHHSSGDVIDLVVGSQGTDQVRDSDTIGTTSNHPFWSVDRQEYVQAGQLAIGERLQTFSGDTKRVVSKLARPGPQPVFNLEVFAEHVYYVGRTGVLAHNAYDVGDAAAARRAYLNQKFGRSGNLDADINARGLEDAIRQNALLATDMARADRIAGRIGSKATTVGTRAHSYFERLNNRMGNRIAGEYRIVTEEFRNAAGFVFPKRQVTFPSGFSMMLPQRGTIGADLVVSGKNGITRIFDLKTHNGTLAKMGAIRQQAFLNRFNAQSLELLHVRQ